MEEYADTVWRLCLLHVKNRADAEDVFQTVFLKYILSSVMFESEEHEKAWFIRVTSNACKDLLKSFFRSHTVPLDELTDLPAGMPEDRRQVLDAVLSLPAKYRAVIHLHYFEGLSVSEMAQTLQLPEGTIKSQLSRGRALLRELLEEVAL